MIGSWLLYQRFYDKHNFQQICVFCHQLKFLTNFILLNNGTLLGFYDWNARYLQKRIDKNVRNYYDDDNTGSDQLFIVKPLDEYEQRIKSNSIEEDSFQNDKSSRYSKSDSNYNSNSDNENEEDKDSSHYSSFSEEKNTYYKF